MEFVEHIATPNVDGVIFNNPFHEAVDGTLCITGHHLILSSRKEDAQEIWVTLQCNTKNCVFMHFFIVIASHSRSRRKKG